MEVQNDLQPPESLCTQFNDLFQNLKRQPLQLNVFHRWENYNFLVLFILFIILDSGRNSNGFEPFDKVFVSIWFQNRFFGKQEQQQRIFNSTSCT